MEMANRGPSLPPLDVNQKSLSIFSPPQHVSMFSTSNQKILQKKLTLLERLQSTTSEESVDEQEKRNPNEQRAANSGNSKSVEQHTVQEAEEEEDEDDLFTRWAKQSSTSDAGASRDNPGAGVHFPASIPSYAYALATSRSRRRAYFDHRGASNAQPQFHGQPPHSFGAAASSSSASAAGAAQALMSCAWMAGWPRFHSAEVDSQERLQQQQQQHATVVLTHPASQPMVVRYLPSSHANSHACPSNVADDLATHSVSPPPPQADAQLSGPQKASDSDAPEKSLKELNAPAPLSRRVSVNSIGVNERLLAMAMKIHEQTPPQAQVHESSAKPSNTSASPQVHLLTRPLSLPLSNHLAEFQRNPAFRSTDRSLLRTIRAEAEDEHFEQQEHELQHTFEADNARSTSPSPVLSHSPAPDHLPKLPKAADDSHSPNPQSALSGVSFAGTADLPFELLRSGVHVYVPWKREERQSKRMSDADPHAFYSFSLSVKAPFLFLLRNIHSKRVKLSILLSRIHFVCLTNDERASIFISYHGRSCHSNRKSKQGSKGPEQSQCKKSAAVSSISTSTSTSSFNKRHLYLWPIDQRDCLSWFHLILRAWRTLKDVQSGAAIPKLNVVEMLKKVLNTWDEANPARAQQTHQGSAPPRVGGTAHAGDAHAQADEDEEQAEQQEQPVSGSDGEESLCYFCRSSRGSTATDRHRDERALQPASSSQADKPFNLQQPLAQHPVANLLQVDGVHMSVTAASPAILAPPPTLTHCAVTSANASCAVSSLTPVVFHNDGSPVQGQQLTNAVPMSMPMPLQIELHCIEESGEDEKGNVCARSSRAVAVRVSRHRRGPSYSAHTFNSPPDPLSNPLTSPQFRPIQRSKSNLVPAEEMCQQMLELRARMQRLEFLLTRLKKDEGTLKARNAGNLAALGCRQKILKEQNILLRKIATQRMYQRLNQPSIYV